MNKDKRRYSDRSEYLKKAVSERRKNLKLQAIKYLGGKCSRCGYSRFSGALEFHHIDPLKKDFSLSTRGLTRSWEKILVELDKCILLCSNCHKEVHGGLSQPPSESSVENGVNCRKPNS